MEKELGKKGKKLMLGSTQQAPELPTKTRTLRRNMDKDGDSPGEYAISILQFVQHVYKFVRLENVKARFHIFLQRSRLHALQLTSTFFHSVLFLDAAEAEVAISPMLPRKERPLVDSNLNEDDRLLPKDKSKSSLNPFNLIKKKKKTAPAPPKRSSSFKEDRHLDPRGLGADAREDFNNGSSITEATLGIDPLKFLCANNNGAGGITNGAPTYPGQIFPSQPRKKVTASTPGVGGKMATTPPGEEDFMSSNSKRFLRSSSASSMPPGSDRTEWKSVTLPRDLQPRHFDSGTLGGKPALPRKRANELKPESAPRGGTLTPPPRLPKKTEDTSDDVFKDAESSPGSSPQTLTPKLGHRSQGDNSRTSTLQADLLKSSAFLGAAGEDRVRRHKQPLDLSAQRDRERGKFAKPKPAPPPPPPSSSKSGKISRSPTQDLSPDSKVKGTPDINSTSTGLVEQARPLASQEGTRKLNTSKGQQPSRSLCTSPTSPPPGVGSSSPVGDQASATPFIPLINTRRSLRKTRQPTERFSSSAITREMVLESTELLRAAISRNSEQMGSHSAVLEAGKNLSKYCMSYVDSIQQMRNKFAFREAINKLECSLRDLQICPTATGGANTPQDFTKLLSSLKEISDIVQR